MSSPLQITKTAEPRPKIAARLFSVQNWTWPLLTLGCLAVAAILDSQVKVGYAGENSFSFTLGFLGGTCLLVVAVVGIIDMTLHFRAKRTLNAAVEGQPQFLEFDEQGIRHGWSERTSGFWAWQTVASAKYAHGAIIFRLGKDRLKVNLEPLRDDEAEALCAFLREKRLLKNDPKKPHAHHKDFRMTKATGRNEENG